VLPVDAESLFRQAEKYRFLARGINDERALAVLEQMACELERRASLVQSLRRLVEAARNYVALAAG